MTAQKKPVNATDRLLELISLWRSEMTTRDDEEVRDACEAGIRSLQAQAAGLSSKGADDTTGRKYQASSVVKPFRKPNAPAKGINIDQLATKHVNELHVFSNGRRLTEITVAMAHEMFANSTADAKVLAPIVRHQKMKGARPAALLIEVFTKPQLEKFAKAGKH